MLGLLKRFDFLRSLFGGDGEPVSGAARMAKERLRKTLIMDQASVSSELIGVIKEAMIGVVSRYLEIDVPHLQLAVERQNSAITLAANIPIVRVRKEGRALMPNPASISMAAKEEERASFSSVAVLEETGEIAIPISEKEPDGGTTSEIKMERRNRRGRRHSR